MPISLAAAAAAAAADAATLSAPLIAFRNLPSGDVGTNAWSIQADTPAEAQPKVQAKATLATGMYTFYRDDTALTVGTQVRMDLTLDFESGKVTCGWVPSMWMYAQASSELQCYHST
mgnify:CR=1 FL=1